MTSAIRPAVIAAIGLSAVAGCRGGRIVVGHEDFAGWDAIVVANRAASVVIVPAIGRVMRFDLAGGSGAAQEKPGFWRHPRLGPSLARDDNGWINFGGDKAWPAPQADWASIVGKGWPPPRTFDAVPYTASVSGSVVELLSPVDPAYGVRVRRRIAIDPVAPMMTIETGFEKVEGPPVKLGVWTITQLDSPERMFVRLPERSAFPDGYKLRLPGLPADLRRDDRLLSLARHPTEKTMIVSDGDALLWLGDGPDLLIENETAHISEAGAWPDGVHAQVYTSPLPDERYVELELLERVRELAPGQSATMRARYTLLPRGDRDPIAEAKRVFGR